MKRTCMLLAVALCCTTMWAKKSPEITVTNAEEFLSSLGPNRTIVIDSRAPLMLTPAVEGRANAGIISEYDYYNNRPNATGLGWYDHFDGKGLSITGFDNLTIKAKDSQKATLLVTPRYVNVLLFDNCRNLTLEGLVLGHTESGYCTAGVLELFRCDNVTVRSCDLFGCGTEAMIITDCMYVDVTNTEMHHCTYHSMHISNSAHVRFKDCKIHDNKEYEQINIIDSRDVWFDRCDFVNLKGPLFNLNCPVLFHDCMFEGCGKDVDRYALKLGRRESTGVEWSQWIQVAGTGVNLRDEPSLTGKKQPLKLKKGEYAPKLDETDKWVKIYQPYSPYGYAWMYKQYAKDVPASTVPEMVRDCDPKILRQSTGTVDLGLSVDWAPTNYGAENAEEYGEFMTWHQATNTAYPDGWRLPTKDEWEELLSLPHKIVQLPDEYRVVIFTAPNGNTLTIPANGFMDEDGNQNFGFYGYYWSRTVTSDGLYPLGFQIDVPLDLCRTGTLVDTLSIGTRLVKPK